MRRLSGKSPEKCCFHLFREKLHKSVVKRLLLTINYFLKRCRRGSKTHLFVFCTKYSLEKNWNDTPFLKNQTDLFLSKTIRLMFFANI